MIKGKIGFGSDAESFVTTVTNEYFPICGIVGGTKDKPKSLGVTGFFIQEDNVAVEWNIPVCFSREEWVSNVSKGVNLVANALPPSLIMNSKSSAVFDRAYVGHCRAAQEFGCDPDYNAWTEEQNPRPNPDNPYFRTVAAHVHISWDDPQPEDQLNLIKLADVFVSLPSVLECEDRRRRTLYGKSGAFRPKDYGVEHRVLDNYWIWDKQLSSSVYTRYFQAIKALNLGLVIDSQDCEKIQEAINTYDTTLAQTLNQKYYNRFVDMSAAQIKTEVAADKPVSKKAINKIDFSVYPTNKSTLEV